MTGAATVDTTIRLRAASERSFTSQGDRSEAQHLTTRDRRRGTPRGINTAGTSLRQVMSQGAWVLVAAVLLATAFGAWRAARDGRFRGTHALRAPAEPQAAPEREPAPLDGLDHPLGERATLLQFSSAFCAPCRATRRVLAEVARIVPGVAHVEIDAEHHLDLVRRLGIARTPTTLVLDASGHEVSRASGAPSKDAVLATLASAVAPASE